VEDASKRMLVRMKCIIIDVIIEKFTYYPLGCSVVLKM